MTVKLLSLDAFGTSLRLDKPFLRMKQNLSSRGLNIPIEIIRDAFMAEMKYYRTHHLDGKDRLSLRDLRVRCAGVLFDSLDTAGFRVDFPPGEKADILLSAVSFLPFEDLTPLIEACRKKGIRLAMTSNWDCSLSETLSDNGLEDAFDAVIVSSAEGVAKPDPALFEKVSVLTQTDPSLIMHIGDEYDNDYIPAIHAGFQAVLLDRESKYFGDAEPVISSLEEAIALLE